MQKGLKVYKVFTEGYNFDVPKALLKESDAWQISKHWLGAYQLLPDYEFVDENNKKWSLTRTFFGDWVGFQASQRIDTEFLNRLSESRQIDDDFDMERKGLLSRKNIQRNFELSSSIIRSVG